MAKQSKMVEYQKQGSGPAFVYVSGIEGTGKNFYKQAADLARDQTVISFPLRPAGRYEIETLADDLVSIIRDAGFERATVLGESFGGLMVMAAALRHPDYFERMILVNTFAAFPNRTKINLGVALCTVLPYSLLQAYRRRTAPRNLFSDDVDVRLIEPQAGKLAGRHAHNTLAGGFPHLFIDNFRHSSSSNMR